HALSRGHQVPAGIQHLRCVASEIDGDVELGVALTRIRERRRDRRVYRLAVTAEVAFLEPVPNKARIIVRALVENQVAGVEPAPARRIRTTVERLALPGREDARQPEVLLRV